MNTTEQSLPALPSRIGKRGVLRDPINGSPYSFTVTDEITLPQSELPSKIICLQRIAFEDGRQEVRLGYYIIGKRPRMLGKWVWGQYAALLPLEDFKAIIRQAEKKGWL